MRAAPAAGGAPRGTRKGSFIQRTQTFLLDTSVFSDRLSVKRVLTLNGICSVGSPAHIVTRTLLSK